MTAAADDRTSVLFVCTHNSARSQLAEALLRARLGDRYAAFSAGTVARGVHPLAVEALAEAGVSTDGLTSKTIDSLGGRPFDVVVTVCDTAREACPYLPARERNLHHVFRDPSAASTEAEQRAAFREVRDEIAAWIDATFGATPAVPGDLLDVLDLLRSAGLPTDDLGTANPVDFRTIRRGGRLVGAVAVESHGAAGLLRSLVVADEARGLGLGSRLVEAAEDLARERCLGALYLLTTTAAPFFEAHGYAPVDRAAVPEAVRLSTEFASVCPASAVCLGKTLGPA